MNKRKKYLNMQHTFAFWGVDVDLGAACFLFLGAAVFFLLQTRGATSSFSLYPASMACSKAFSLLPSLKSATVPSLFLFSRT